jgi:hypothetical protein
MRSIQKSHSISKKEKEEIQDLIEGHPDSQQVRD